MRTGGGVKERPIAQPATTTPVKAPAPVRPGKEPAKLPTIKLPPQLKTPEEGKKKPTPKLWFSNLSDRERRKALRDRTGVIAWRQGQLNKKDVWWAISAPYESEADIVSLVGNKPAGATLVRGPGSAMGTAQLLHHKNINKKVLVDIGIVDANFEPISGRKGIKLTFSSDPKQITKGDITIGGKRDANISGRGKVFPLAGGRQ